ncbi:hypothetical protein BJX70DRAFT_362988 [Aspergillus crustosus]
MASGRFSPPRRPFQVPPTLAPKASDRLAVPIYHTVDPLLGNLSPESTLQALSSTDAVQTNEQAAHDILAKSIYQASPSERALGIRAAVAAQKLGQWYREVHSWVWPKRTDAHLGKGFTPPSDADESPHCGSLPTAVVEEHEKRIDEIRDGMDSLDVEELKEHVLNAHIPGRSRPSSANSTMSVPPPLSYVQLSDFTAVITATILRALPLLSRLNRLLSDWHVRLLVLRQIPGLLHSLRFARLELNSALDLLKSTLPPTEKDVLYSIANYHAKRLALESTVVSAGRKMDRILDSLDDREDSLPESWIDNLESVEAEFAIWVMQAERQTVENEWRRLSARSNENDKPEPMPVQPEFEKHEDTEEPSFDVPISPVTETQVVKFSSPEPQDTTDNIIAAEPPTRLVPFQIGRAPMETIVEEMGSPFDRPLSRIATNINERTMPDSPSPLPSDPVHPRDALTSIPPMQLDTEVDNIYSAEASHDLAQNKLEDDLDKPQTLFDASAIQESIDVSGKPIHELPIISAAETSVSCDEPKLDLEIDESAPESPAEVSGNEESLLSQEKLSNRHPDNKSIDPPFQPEKPQQDSEIGEQTAQIPFDASPIEDPLQLDGKTGKNAFDDMLTETPVAQEETILPSVASIPETNTTEEDRFEEPQPRTISISSPAIPEGNALEEDSFKELQPGILDTSAAKIPEEDAPEENGIEDLPPRVLSTPSVEATPTESMPMEEAEQDGFPAQSPVDGSSSADPILFEPKFVAQRPNPTQASIESSSIEHDVLPEHPESSETVEGIRPIWQAYKEVDPPRPENNRTSEATVSAKYEEESKPAVEIDACPLQTPVEEKIIAAVPAVVATPPLMTYPAKSPSRCGTPLGDDLASLPNLFIPHDSHKASPEPRQSEEPEDENTAPKKPLDSPIKLSKARPGRLDLDKHKSKGRVRRTSNASDGSISDYPSLVSSPEIPGPRTFSSNGTPLLVETPPHFPAEFRPSDSVRRNNDHTLREDRLLHLDAQKPSPREAFAHNRTLSLPLQRFINERLDMTYDTGSGTEEDVFAAKPSASKKKASAERRLKSKSATSPGEIRRFDGQHLAPTREESSGPDSEGSSDARRDAQQHIGKKFPNVTPVEPLSSVTTARLKQRLTAHPSLESIGPYKSNGQPTTSKAILSKTKSRSSSLTKQFIRPKDQMDEKINSILTTLPGRIHLVPADQDDDTMSVASAHPFRRERLRSDSPQGTPSRSFTPTPSLTLRPALSRRRHSHAPEESSVKLYHLHRGGKSAPTKLFVRTVGESGGRLMVRVGGGWADLAEYLREYAIHHGRRHVSETPRVEVEGLPSRESPSYSPPGSRVPSGSGRHVPARPRSVLSNRPSSSLAVRKTRRSSNVSDLADIRTASAGDALNVSFSPMSSAFPGRRLSVSSNVSAGAVSSVSEFRHGSPGASHAMPLGLAGPKPRAKHAAITPEGEAWVEDVLGQARRSSSLRPFKYTLPPPETDLDGNTPPTLPKARSISDIGKAGGSKRVALRGLGPR